MISFLFFMLKFWTILLILGFAYLFSLIGFITIVTVSEVTMTSHSTVLKLSSKLVPSLLSNLHKGSAGRIAIVGGSKEYTGAPYYAAITSLRVGADISYIFCSEAAAIPIKSYSPEIMVLPCLDSRESLQLGLDRIPTAHAIVIGPGLGRRKASFQSVDLLVDEGLKHKKSIVLDGDALFKLSVESDFREKIRNKNVFLTPNKAEFNRIYSAIFPNEEEVIISSFGKVNKNWFNEKEIEEIIENKQHYCYKAIRLARELGCFVFQKGSIDIITDGKVVAINHRFGSNRRCGGQGDILAGSLGVFFGWIDIFKPEIDHPQVLAGFAVSCLIRKANENGFKKKGRSLVAPDIINEIGVSFEELFGTENKKEE